MSDNKWGKLEISDLGSVDEIDYKAMGLVPTGEPFTITGTWLPVDHRIQCPICGMRFEPHALEGQPHAVAVIGDVELGPICEACAVDILT